MYAFKIGSITFFIFIIIICTPTSNNVSVLLSLFLFSYHIFVLSQPLNPCFFLHFSFIFFLVFSVLTYLFSDSIACHFYLYIDFFRLSMLVCGACDGGIWHCSNITCGASNFDTHISLDSAKTIKIQKTYKISLTQKIY